jgi:hypothetical protein
MTPGGSSTHLHTNDRIQKTEHTYQSKNYEHTYQPKYLKLIWEVRAVNRLCQLYPGICLTDDEKAWKSLS